MNRNNSQNSKNIRNFGNIKLNENNDRNCVRIYCANIRSIAKNFDQLRVYLDNQGNKYDTLALTETSVKTEHIHLYQMTGYRIISQARSDNRRSGGVALYVRDSLEIEHVTNKNMITGNIVSIRVRRKEKRENLLVKNLNQNVFTIMLVYRDCSSSKRLFVEEMEKFINDEKVRNIVVMGDMNIDILDRFSSAAYMNMLKPTRDNSCLDHVMARIDDMTIYAEVLDVNITDHRPIEIKIKLDK